MYFELNSSQLICYKDRNNNKVYEWNITDISIYIGVEKKRKPPTLYVQHHFLLYCLHNHSNCLTCFCVVGYIF